MMAWQGFALVLMGAFLISLYDITNKKLLVKNQEKEITIQKQVVKIIRIKIVTKEITKA